MRITVRPRGFTILEVLIALLVFSLGLLGMAGLLVISVKTNHSAYLRTQASFMAQSMGDRMRANVPRVWAGDYDGDYTGTTGDTDPCPSGTACTRANIATRDKAQFETQLGDQLPNASAQIACTPDGTVSVSPSEQAAGAPYTGLCNIVISWSEASLERSADGAPADQTPDTETFAWTFAP
jgi:type IV pilus assembly protein PilV